MAEQNKEILALVSIIQADKDKSKILSVCALLRYDNGGEYSPTDYKRAIARLKARTAKTGDTADGFMQRGIEWLKEHKAARRATA